MRFDLKKYRGVIFQDTEQGYKIRINPDLVVSKMSRGIVLTFINRGLKVWKIVHWWALFVKSICFSYKISEKICVMALKGYAKFKGNLTRDLKNDIRNLVNFHVSSGKSGNLHFDGLLLSKAYKGLHEEVQKSYVSRHWREMQSLKKDWLLVAKLTWGIWWILMWTVASQHWHFDVALLFSVAAYKVSAKTVQKNYLSWHWKKIQTLKKNCLLFEKWHEEFGDF